MFVNRVTAEVYFQEWSRSGFSLKQQYISKWTAHEKTLYWRIVEFSEVVLVKMHDCVLGELRLKESMAPATRQEGINLAVTCLYSSIVCWHILIKQQKNQIRLLFANGKHGNSLVSCDEQQFTQQRIFIFPANSKVHWHNWPKKAMLKGCAEQLKPELSNRPLNCQCKRALLNVKWKACVDAVMCSVLGASSVSPLSSSDCPKSTATLELRTSSNAIRNVC